LTKGKLLHVGCGGDPLPYFLQDYAETRLDIDDTHKPDILASMTDMGDIGEFDAILCSHSLEHLLPHDVAKALTEFVRVLKPGGFSVIFVPDLEDVKATEEPLFEAPCGTITGLDLLYGLRSLLHVMPYMAHRTGFIAKTLEQAVLNAGFTKAVTTRLPNYNLMCVGVK